MRRIGLMIAALLAAVAPVAAEPFRMLVNHGPGWSAAGDFSTAKECEQEAAAYALKHSAQAGCTPVRAALQWQSEVRFRQLAQNCAADAGVEIVLKPGAKLTVLGTSRARFSFDRCMADSGQALDSAR